MWLAGLNTRRLKVNLPLIAAFVAGLLWTRGRASCLAIGQGGAFAHDALNRMLKSASLRALLQMAALTQVEKVGGAPPAPASYRRIGDRPIALAAAPVRAKLRPIKLERRKRRQKAHPIKCSGTAA